MSYRFFVIDLHGADAVLGVACREQFREIKINYHEDYIKFVYEGKEGCLRGLQPGKHLETMSVSQFQHSL